MTTGLPHNKKQYLDIFFWLTSFCLPILIFCLLLFGSGIYPFGSESFLTEDLKYQYIDFFTWFKSVLAGETSLLYTANLSLGTNAWGLFGYYLSSPLNLLIVFFDEAHLTDFVVLITALKIGLINLSMSFYLHKRFKLNKTFIMTLALCYSLSLWTITQMRNPMWLDALIFLPLVLYGAYCLITKGAWKLLLFSTALTVISCWYTAYMVILFSLPFFLFELFLQSQAIKLKAKQILIILLKFAGVLCAALLLSAFTFLPTILAMAGGEPFAGFHQIKIMGFKDLYASLFFGNWVLHTTPQNFFGTATFLLVCIFFCIQKIPLKQKIITAAFLVFMIASTWLAPLEFIWCGFKIPNGFYCRFTFLTAFLFVFVAATTLQCIQEKQVSKREVFTGGAILCAGIVLCFSTDNFIRIRYFAFMLGFAILGVVLLLLYLKPPSKKSLQSVAASILLLAVCGELIYYGLLTLPFLYEGYPQESHDAYVEESKTQLTELRDFDTSRYRLDKTYTRAHATALNEGLALHYLQLSSYSSAHNKAAVDFLNDLGYSAEREISVQYVSPILASDSLLGLKYASSSALPAGFEDVGLATTNTGKTFYQNPYALSLGYLVDEKVLTASFDNTQNPFERQNTFMNALLGENKGYFVQAKTEEVSLTPDQKKWTVTFPERSIGYVYVEAESPHSLWLSLNGEPAIMENWRYGHSIRELGASELAQEYTAALSTTDPTLGLPDPVALAQNDTCLFYSLDLDAFEEALATLSVHQFEFDSFESGFIEGSFFADEDSLLLLTIPHEKGWSVQINGVTQEPLDVFEGALMAIPLSAGENEISMTYHSPGLFLGAILSIGTLFLILIFALRKDAQ